MVIRSSKNLSQWRISHRLSVSVRFVSEKRLLYSWVNSSRKYRIFCKKYDHREWIYAKWYKEKPNQANVDKFENLLRLMVPLSLSLSLTLSVLFLDFKTYGHRPIIVITCGCSQCGIFERHEAEQIFRSKIPCVVPKGQHQVNRFYNGSEGTR